MSYAEIEFASIDNRFIIYISSLPLFILFRNLFLLYILIVFTDNNSTNDQSPIIKYYEREYNYYNSSFFISAI